MVLKKKLLNLFSKKRDLVPLFTQQGAFLCQSSEALAEMLQSVDQQRWLRCERQIKTMEVQGDALVTEFYQQIHGRIIGSLDSLDLQTVAMCMDDCLDVIKDASKAVLIYHPAKIDGQLQELAQIVVAQAHSLREMLPMLWDIKHKFTSIILQCERVTELEHSADDVYEEYVGYIFANEPDLREMTKYKNLAEILEKATDSEKRVADNVRKLLLKFAPKQGLKV